MTSLKADHILTCNRIYPVTEGRPRKGSLAIRSGRVISLAMLDELSDLIGPDTQIVEAGDRVVLPGLIDSHIHLSTYARSLSKLDCNVENLDQLLSLVGEAAATVSDGEWIIGHGWDQNRWGTWPSASHLQTVAPKNPVYLTAKSLHAALANPLALSLAGIRPDTPDPESGEFQRDSRGEPTGILLEGAMEVVSNCIPPLKPHALADLLQHAQAALWEHGITGVHDFDGPDCFSALQLLQDRDLLGIRVLKQVRREFLQQALELGIRSGFGNDWLRLGNVKVFMDGALGPRTASMLAPYDDVPESRGILLLDREHLIEIALQAATAGFGMTIHAIGDKATHEALQALARVRADLPAFRPKLPHRMEHVQILAEEEFHRLSELGIVASMQPIHAISDRTMADQAWSKRVWRSYPWRTLLDGGTDLVFGSDAPVDDPNPFWGIHAAVTRQARDGNTDPWVPEQTISRAEALKAYTVTPAAIAGMGGRAGQLGPGSFADLLVLEKDPMQVPDQELHELRPVATMSGGEWRFRDFG